MKKIISLIGVLTIILFVIGSLVTAILLYFSRKSPDNQTTITTTSTNSIFETTKFPVENTYTEYTYTVINEFPHDPNAFTQGFVYEDGFFYEGTGIKGESSLKKIDISTGNVLQQTDLDNEYFGEGIVLWEDRIFQLTWQSMRGFVYDKKTFEHIDTFTYTTEGWGFTHNGRNLIMSDGTSTLYFWDPETLEETKTLTVRNEDGEVDMLNELEYINGRIYANIWLTDTIVKIDPETGNVTGLIDLTGLLPEDEKENETDVLNGIAYDEEGDRLFVTGKRWPKVFQIELREK